MSHKLLWSEVHKRRCAQCHGPMAMKYIDGNWEIVCPKGCQPGGHVSAEYVERFRAENALDAFEVAQNYPELNPNKLSEEEIANGKEALWG